MKTLFTLKPTATVSITVLENDEGSLLMPAFLVLIDDTTGRVAKTEDGFDSKTEAKRFVDGMFAHFDRNKNREAYA